MSYNRADVLNEAMGIITKDRNADYGGPEDSFARIAVLWGAWLHTSVSAIDVAAMMIMLKLARLNINPTHMDSWIDIAGYAGCGGEIAAASRINVEGPPPMADAQAWKPTNPAEYPKKPRGL